MVVYKAPLEQKSGKEGGNIYRSDNCGEHVQAYPRLIKKPPSQKQLIRRDCFLVALHRFSRILTYDQITAWWDYSRRHPVKNKKGETIILAASAHYTKYNINRCVEHKPWVDDPPA